MFTLLRRKLTHLHRDNYCHLCNRNFKNNRGLRLHKRVMHSKTTFHALIVLLITVLIGLYSSQTRAYEMISPVSTRPGEVKPVATGAVDPTQAPVPSATPTPTPTAEKESIEQLICDVFVDNCEEAVRVAKCESGLDPKAKNKTSSARGLYQVMQSWHKIDEKWLLNPVINIEVAHKLYVESGNSFSPHWDASKHCWGK